MISRTPEEKRRYEARLKFQRDEQWRLESALETGRMEGRMEGEAKGRAVGQITTLQEVLGVPVSREEDLQRMTIDQLAALSSELQEKLRQRPTE